MIPTDVEARIKTMLEDTCKGLATRAELKSAVAGVVAEKFAEDEFLKAAKSDIQDLRSENDTLAKEIRDLRRSRFAPIKTSDGRYNGIWGSMERAKLFGMFVLASLAKVAGAKQYLDDAGIEIRQATVDEERQKAMGEDYPATGGVLVPVEFIPNLIVLIENYGVFRRNAQEWPMSSESGYAPMQSSDVTVYCPGFGTAPTASDPGFKNVGLQAQKWMTLTAIDSELSEDAAIAVGEIVGRSIARAFAKKEDQCGFIGDGTSTYFNRKGARVVLREVDSTIGNVKGLRVQGTAGAWSAIVLADLLDVAGKLPGYADDGLDAKWFPSKPFYYTVMISLALGAGGATAAEVIHTGYTPAPSFLGRPVEFTQVMPHAKESADHCPVLLANLRIGSYLGDRRRLTIDQSKEAYFTTDQIGIRGTERIAPTIYGVGDTTDPGPIVGLWADIA